jgi:hypothetical protein
MTNVWDASIGSHFLFAPLLKAAIFSRHPESLFISIQYLSSEFAISEMSSDIITERLILRHLVTDDTTDVIAVNSIEEVRSQL